MSLFSIFHRIIQASRWLILFAVFDTILVSNEQAKHEQDNMTKTSEGVANSTQADVPGSKDGECRLLGPFAILVQAALGLLALLSLVWKRWRETPPRPLKVWFFDVSKQVFGSVLLHIANLFLSMLSSEKLDISANRKPTSVTTVTLTVRDATRSQPNPCSFYLLNLAIDVSISYLKACRRLNFDFSELSLI